jgi:putative membrane protein
MNRRLVIIAISTLSTITANMLSPSGAAFAVNISKTDIDLANKLTKGSMAEIEMGNLAQNKAKNPAVKDFGQRMVKDHTAVMNQVKEWAQKNKVSVSTKISPENQTHMKELAQFSAEDFDKHFIEMMLKDHQKEVSHLQEYTQTAPNTSFKPLVMKTLPILENHLRIAEHVAGQIGIPPTVGLNQPEHPETV